MDRAFTRAVSAAALAAVAGCGIENTVLYPHTVDVFEQSPTDRVDVLFVVDDSGSMLQEQQRLAAGFTTFLKELENSETKYQIGLVSTTLDPRELEPGRLIGKPGILVPGSDTATAFRQRVMLGTDGSDYEQGLQVAVEALWSNPGFVREGASLVVVFVTDENDCSHDGLLAGMDPVDCYRLVDQLVPVPELVEQIQAVKRDGETVRLGGILGPFDDSCAEAYSGTRYAQAIRMTGGPMARICDNDWTPVLRELGVLAVGILDRFELSQVPDPESIVVRVDGREVLEDAVDGWTYDWQVQMIAFHGRAVPERGAEIEIEYDVVR